MGALTPKNIPPTNVDPTSWLATTTFTFNLADGDTQIAYIPPQTNAFSPITIIFTDYTTSTLQITASPISAIAGDTALWYTVPLTSNLYILNGTVTAINVGTSATTTVICACM